METRVQADWQRYFLEQAALGPPLRLPVDHVETGASKVPTGDHAIAMGVRVMAIGVRVYYWGPRRVWWGPRVYWRPRYWW